jgi:RNA polymerase sigma factor (sigma-70 family)
MSTAKVQAWSIKDFREKLAAHLESKRPYHQALTITRDGQTAEELVQDGAIRALERWEKYDQTRPLNPWFFRVMFNRFSLTKYHMKRDLMKLVSLDAPLGDPNDDDSLSRADLLRDETPLQEASFFASVEEDALTERTRIALASVRARERMALIAKDLRGMDFTDVAAALGCSIGNARLIVADGREQFKNVYAALERPA